MRSKEPLNITRQRLQLDIKSEYVLSCNSSEWAEPTTLGSVMSKDEGSV